MLDRLEVYNFKSYKGRQTIGPFQSFTAVIGPNGAGKSNLMDAISFVLGVRSATLRSAALKDLIYRSGSHRQDAKGKQKQVEANDGIDNEEGDDSGSGSGDENGLDNNDDQESDGTRKAWVRAIYIEDDGTEWTFQRSISAAGASDYKLNGKSVTYKRYNEQLESFKILVKAMNFLVFQGDVEQVASQSPKDLAHLIDRISGSLDHKDDYDRCRAELDKATEQSMMQHSRRKGVNGEIKQYKEMKKEAERWKKLQAERENAIVHHLVWKLFHIEQGIENNTEAIQEKNDQLADMRATNSEADDQQKAAKKELNRATKDATRKEKEVKQREKDLDARKPELDAIDAKISHAKRKLKSASDQAQRVERDLENGEEKLLGLKSELADIQDDQKRASAAAAKAAKSKGMNVTPADVEEYRELRNAAAVKAVTEREQLLAVNRDLKTKRTALADAQDSQQVAQRKGDKLQDERAALTERHDEAEVRVGQARTELNRVQKELVALQARKTQTAQTEVELNEKLYDTLQKLQQAGAEKQETEKEAKFKETLASLKRAFPGVRGRVIDLCRPTQKKYELAVTTVLGRHIDSVVVDSEKTAIDCIEYMRVQRAGQATFVPLDTIQTQTPNDKLRSLRTARLAIDCITFDNGVEKAMQHACGNAIICETMDAARAICYDQGQDTKAVTLEGTVIHRSGLITGGISSRSNGNRSFEDREVEGLRRKEAELRSKLGEIHKNKPKANAEDALNQAITLARSEQTIAQDNQSSISARIKDLDSELAVLAKSIQGYQVKIQQAQEGIDSLTARKNDLESIIASEEEGIFRAFCKRIGVDSIRVYEEALLGEGQAEEEAKLRFKTRIARVTNQIEFEDSQLDGTRQRLETLRATIEQEQAALEQFTEERERQESALEVILGEIEQLREELDGLQTIVQEKSAKLDEVRQTSLKSAKQLDAALKEIAGWNDTIERLTNERFAIYRRCKMDQIDLPLLEGDLSRISMDEAIPPEAPMDVDGDDNETQQALKVTDYGIKVDFEELGEDEEEDASERMEQGLLTRINQLQAEADKMSPNLKSIDRLGESENRFKQIDAEFEEARETVKAAKDRFNAVKKKRCDLFNKAYQHISDRIDPVYKDLTKGTAAPMGGVAYLSLEDSEEPYLHGIKYHAMPPMKRFRDMDQLSGGERTMASLSLLFAIHSYHRSPFFVLDEVDAALDNTNVARVARYVESISSPSFQFIVISLKNAFFERASALVGVYRQEWGSKNLTLDLSKYAN